MDEIAELLTRGVDKIYPNKEALEKTLRSGKKLKLYQGFDPSMPNLHLGNLVGMIKLRQFQKLGHKVIFLIGDFTGMIGDPTDKSATRKKLSREEVVENSKKWKEQASRILEFQGDNSAEIKFNSQWLDRITFKEMIELASYFTVNQMIERDMFQLRIAENKPIHLHEFLYPIAVSIDCVEMDVDLEIGGSDQTFNMLAGRTLMKALKNKEKYVLTTKLLIDKEGNKVGKTTGNALFLNSTPEQFFGGIMSFPDETINLGFELLTACDYLNLNESIKSDPMYQKKRLGFEVVKLLWGEDRAKKAKNEFENVFQKKELPDNITSIILESSKINMIDLLIMSNMAKSRSEAKRLVTDGAVELDNQKVIDVNIIANLKSGSILKVGKHRFIKIITEK